MVVPASSLGCTGVGPLVPWEDAGGEVPSLVGIYPVDTPAVDPSLGADPSIESEFVQDGWMVDGSFRIQTGAGATDGEGYIAVRGLPVAPKYKGTPPAAGNFIGFGILADLTNSGRIYDAQLVLDPSYSLTEPIIFYSQQVDTAADNTTLNSAAVTGEVTTDTPEQVDAVNVLAPVSFAPPTPIVHGGGAAYPTYGAMAAAPFGFSGGLIINITFRYQGVTPA